MNDKSVPIDTSQVALPQGLLELAELLASSVHDVWARQRRLDGWSYGPERNDLRKEHPDLVPYGELPEGEKEYDRLVAFETIKTLLALGYRLDPLEAAPPRPGVPSEAGSAGSPLPAKAAPAIAGSREPGGGRSAATGSASASEPARVLQLLTGPTGSGPGGRLAERPGGGPSARPIGSAAPDLTSLLALWQAHPIDAWSRTPEIYRLLGERIRRLGEPLVAYDVVREGREHWPQDVRLRQIQAQTLLQTGATERAKDIAEELQSEGHSDEETLGILARTHKELAGRAGDPAERRLHLLNAVEAYLDAYRKTGGSWTGINAASLALLVGKTKRARSLAREVRAQCLNELNGSGSGLAGDPGGRSRAQPRRRQGRRTRPSATPHGAEAYWTLATLGEAALVLGEWSESEDWYSQAAAAGQGQFGQLCTTRRQARLLTEHLGRDPEWIERCMPVPRVVVFAGHRVDPPEREAPRFPSHLGEIVQDAIRERLEKLNAGLGYASAACGSDILFLEAILERRGEAHVVLPYGADQFRKDYVEIVPGAGWGVRFDRVLERATKVLTASRQKLERGSASWDYANMLLHGLAGIRAAQLETELVPMAVWDGRLGDGPGGTASIVEGWQALGYEVEIIDLAALAVPGARCQVPGPTGRSTKRLAAPPTIEPGTWHLAPGTAAEGGSEFAARIMALLFADVVGFSKLTDQEIPPFVQQFLGMVAELVATSPHAPIKGNTWGDGLYFVFQSVRDAGLFALQLCHQVEKTDWVEKGLSAPLGLRIGLHAGPVYQCLEPVTGQMSYMGSHVSHAARIEPITPPNQVYSSEPFAALAVAQRVSDFICEYVGQTPLAKGHGTFRTYHVRGK